MGDGGYSGMAVWKHGAALGVGPWRTACGGKGMTVWKLTPEGAQYSAMGGAMPWDCGTELAELVGWRRHSKCRCTRVPCSTESARYRRARRGQSPP